MTVENLHTKTKRLLELDALRGIAAFIVVLYHYTVRYNEIYGNAYALPFTLRIGQYGVLLFFIISGFVIFMTLEHTQRSMDFIVSRVSRLYPTYWSCIFITFTIVSIFTLPGREYSLKTAILNMSMMQNYFNVASIDGVYWTLFIELAFYALMFTIFLIGCLKHIEIFGVFLLLIIVTAHILEYTFHVAISQHLKTMFLLEYGHLFFAGIIFYKLKTHRQHWARHLCIGLCLAVQFIVSSLEPALVIAACFTLFYLLINNYLTIVSKGILIYLGHISYSLYLLHQNIGYIIMRFLFEWNIPAWLVLLVPILASIGLASFVTYLIERPAQKAIRSCYKQRKVARTC